MFVSDRFVFLELHKTGTTHVRRLLRETVGGVLDGKHNQARPDLLDGSRVVLGSVRNPWDWYVSLWAFGCGRRGDLYTTTTGPRRLRGHGWRSDPAGALGNLARELARSPEEWRRCYTDPDDVDAFRRWLVLVLGGRLPYQLYEYGAPELGRSVGLMSYRYLQLFCATPATSPALGRLDTFAAIRAFELAHNFVDHFIRNEALEDTFIDALRQSGVELGEAQLRSIRERARLNASSRRAETHAFYDAGTAALVAESERLIIQRFGYASPLAATKSLLAGDVPATEAALDPAPAISALEGSLVSRDAPGGIEPA